MDKKEISEILNEAAEMLRREADNKSLEMTGKLDDGAEIRSIHHDMMANFAEAVHALAQIVLGRAA